MLPDRICAGRAIGNKGMQTIPSRSKAPTTVTMNILESDGRMVPPRAAQSVVIREPGKAVSNQVLTPGESHAPQTRDMFTPLGRKVCSR